MPLIVPTPDPFGVEDLSTAWSYIALFTLDAGSKNIRIVYHTYKDKASAYSGKSPIKVDEINIKAEAQPAVYGPAPLISPYVPAVYEDQEVDGVMVPVEVSPAVDPVYGEAPLLKTALPSFDTAVSENGVAYATLLGYIDQLALGHIFVGGSVEQAQA